MLNITVVTWIINVSNILNVSKDAHTVRKFMYVAVHVRDFTIKDLYPGKIILLKLNGI